MYVYRDGDGDGDVWFFFCSVLRSFISPENKKSGFRGTATAILSNIFLPLYLALICLYY